MVKDLTLKNIYIVLLIIIVFLLKACKSEDDIKIGFLYPSKEILRFNKEVGFFKKYANDKGVQVIVKQASNDEAIQFQQATEVINQGVNALVIVAVNVNTSAAIVRLAKSKDIPVVAYNRMIVNSDLDFFVASSNDQIGKIMVDAAIKEKPQGNYVIFNGDKFDKNGDELQKAISKHLLPHVNAGKVNVVYESFVENWSNENSAYEMEKVISTLGKNIDAVLAGFDGMAEGVIEVLKKYELNGKVVVTGQDAELRGCRNIVEGNQTVTVYHPLNKLAEKAAEITIEIAKGNSVTQFVNSTEVSRDYKIPTHRVNSIAVTKDNIDEVLIKSGVYKKEEIYR